MTRELGQTGQLEARVAPQQAQRAVEIGGGVNWHGRGRGLLVLLDVVWNHPWAPHAIDAILCVGSMAEFTNV